MRRLGWEPASGLRTVGVSRARLPTELTYVLGVPAGGGKRHVAVPLEA